MAYYDYGTHTPGYYETLIVTQTGGVAGWQVGVVVVGVMVATWWLTRIVERRRKLESGGASDREALEGGPADPRQSTSSVSPPDSSTDWEREQAAADRALIRDVVLRLTEPTPPVDTTTVPPPAELDLPATDPDDNRDWTDELVPDVPPTWGGVATDLFGEPDTHPIIGGTDHA